MPQTSDSPKILISSCLLGYNVKYDGKNNSIMQNDIIEKWLRDDVLVPFCPEVEGGLPIPRVPCEIVDGRVLNREGEDKTKEFETGAIKALELVKRYDIKIAIMKSKSPSCGNGKIYDGNFSGKLIEGDGISVKYLKLNGVKIYDEKEIREAYEEFERLRKS